jgi:hypothetical protein
MQHFRSLRIVNDKSTREKRNERKMQISEPNILTGSLIEHVSFKGTTIEGY